MKSHKENKAKKQEQTEFCEETFQDIYNLIIDYLKENDTIYRNEKRIK